LLLSLNPHVVLRSEPQFQSTYAAFDYRGIGTRFYSKWQFDILEHLARNASHPEDLSRILMVDEHRLEEFLASQIRNNILVEVSEEAFRSIYVPPRARPEAFQGFPVPFLSAPTTVDLFLSRACNLRCSHCFADGGIPMKNELSYEEWISSFDQLEEMGVLEIRLNGGEPFMRRGIYDLLNHLKEKRYHKVMITNGTLISEKAVDALASSEITPTVSLDGATAQVHDTFRGVPGAFQKTVKAMQRLQHRGMTYGVNTCIHGGNLAEIEDTIRLAAKLGAARIGLLSLIEVGRMAKTKVNMISEPEYLMIGLRILGLAKKYKNKIEITEEIVSDELPLQSIGLYTCSIDANGQVYPSNRVLGDPRFRVGSVREASLREIWFSENWIPFRRTSQRLKALGLEGSSLRM